MLCDWTEELRKEVPGYGVDPVELVCPDCSDRVHLSCMEICLVCEATVCVQCHADHVSGKCPKVPAIRAPAGAGGNAAPSTLMPACLDNKGKVTSAIERLALHSPYFPAFAEPHDKRKVKPMRPRVTLPEDLRAMKSYVSQDDMKIIMVDTYKHVEKSDTIMMCRVCRQPKRVTRCYDCGTGDLCSECVLDHGCLEPLCGYCGGRTLDPDIDKSTCNACGRRDLCVRCLPAHGCDVLIDDADNKLSEHKGHLEGVEYITAEEAEQEWELSNQGMTVVLPLCKRCKQNMTVDDEGEKFCKGCRLTEAEEAGLKRTCVEIRQRLEKLNKTDLFWGEKQLDFCV